MDENIHEKSVFVKIDEYKDVLGLFDKVKLELQKSRDTLQRIKELRKEEETEIELWNNSVNEIAKKIGFIDSALGESEGQHE